MNCEQCQELIHDLVDGQISQRDEFDAQACSHCGRILPVSAFGKRKHTKRGISRVCRDCSAPKQKIVHDGQEWAA